MRRVLKEKIVFRLFLMLMLCIGIPVMVFSVISYYMSYHSIYQDYIESKGNLNKQIAENVEENFNALKSQSIGLYNYENIAYMLNADRDNQTAEYLENYNLLYKSLVSIIQGNPKLDSISVSDTDGGIKFYYDRLMASENLNKVASEKWFAETIEAGGRVVIVPPHVNAYTNSMECMISVCQVILDPYNDQIVGVMKLDQRTANFEKIFDKIEKDESERIVVYDRQGNVFYSDTELSEAESREIFRAGNIEQTTSGVWDFDEDDLIIQGRSSNEEWQVISLIREDSIKVRADFIKSINTLLTIILFFVCAVLAVLVSLSINRPIRQLTASISRFQEGDMNEQVHINRSDEFGAIGTAFNNMIASIRKLINEEYKVKLLKKQAEFESYQSQINPHYLFNTLNSIKAVAIQGDAEKTADMIQYLSDNFRYTLNRGVYLVAFREEMAHVDKYIYLQKIRFQDKCSVVTEYDEEVLDNEIPRMVLQPIIENAFQHGLEPASERCEIKITALIAGDDFIIYVSNTGKVLAEQRLTEINQQLAVDQDMYQAKNADKIGIYNVNARIRYHYGEQYGLKFISGGEGVTTIRIRLPDIKVSVNRSDRIGSEEV